MTSLPLPAYLVVLVMILTVEDCPTVPALLSLERITEETLHAGRIAEICL